jgi:hypothetical protein
VNENLKERSQIIRSLWTQESLHPGLYHEYRREACPNGEEDIPEPWFTVFPVVGTNKIIGFNVLAL